jgi:acyl-CoA dehydrogenase
MLTLGGKLKIKELLSARLGDVLSSMYLASTVLKHFENQGRRTTDLPLVEWSIRTLMYQAQEQLHSFLRNFPNRPVAFFLRCFIFPRGRTYSAPSDELSRTVVDLITHSGEARENLSEQAYTTLEPGNPLGLLQEALELTEKYEPLELKLRLARKEGLIKADYFGYQIDEAERGQVISQAEAAELRIYHEKVLQLLAVDDFEASELVRPAATTSAPAAKRAAAKKSAKRKTATAAKESADKNNSN